MIAMAIACRPELLIADEPTTALDVTVQAEILGLMQELKRRRGMSLFFITHDFGVVAQIADRVAVMREGRIVETGILEEVLERPAHDYTRQLLAAVPENLTRTSRHHPAAGAEPPASPAATGVPEAPPFPATTETLRAGGPVGSAGDPGSAGVPPASTFARIDRWRACGPLRARRPRSRERRTIRSCSGWRDWRCTSRSARVCSSARWGTCGRWTASISASTGDRSSRWWANRAAARPPSDARCCASSSPPEAGCISTGGSSPASPVARCAPMRRRLQFVFQDPASSLNPRLTVATALTEPMAAHGIGENLEDRLETAAQTLVEVQLAREHLWRYPHELSGGQRQRIGIARALCLRPDFVVCDEVTSALDVSVQAEVLQLLLDLRRERALTLLFITHDIGVVEYLSDTTAVMHEGQIVELGPTARVCTAPEHPYTRRLIAAVPRLPQGTKAGI